MRIILVYSFQPPSTICQIFVAQMNQPCGATDLFWHICGYGASRHSYFTVPPEQETIKRQIYYNDCNVETFLRQHLEGIGKVNKVSA